MLLRASGEHKGETLGLSAINGEQLEQSGIAHAGLLIRYADTLVNGTEAEQAGLRDEVRAELGSEAFIDCAAVASVFNAVVRIADATGIPLEAYKEELSVDLRRDLGIDDYR